MSRYPAGIIQEAHLVAARLRISPVPWLLLVVIMVLAGLPGCHRPGPVKEKTRLIKDQLGREVTVPAEINRIAALHHFGGKIVYALGQQDKLVEQALYGIEAAAVAAVDKHFAALPHMLEGHEISIEGLVGLRPQVAFVYASFDRSDMRQLEDAGIRVIAVRGETLEESFTAVRLVAMVLGCEDKAESYLQDCRRILDLVKGRITDLPERKRVMFAGPKSVYTVATGEMLQTPMLELAGAVNVAAALKGFWADVSPEQVAVWNPDVILLGSTLSTYGLDSVLENPQYATVAAIKTAKVHIFPSNVGWWDYPAPHCVLGVLWTAKTLYPERFTDVDLVQVADEFYTRYLGHSFTALGGRL